MESAANSRVLRHSPRGSPHPGLFCADIFALDPASRLDVTAAGALVEEVQAACSRGE